MLAPATVLIALAFPVGDVLKAIGRPGTLNLMVFTRFVVAVVALWWAARQSLYTVAVVQLAISAVWLILNLGVARTVARLPVGASLWSMVPAAVGALAMAVAVKALQYLSDPSPWVDLISAAVVGAVVYGAVIWLLDRAWLIEMRGRLSVRSA